MNTEATMFDNAYAVAPKNMIFHNSSSHSMQHPDISAQDKSNYCSLCRDWYLNLEIFRGPIDLVWDALDAYKRTSDGVPNVAYRKTMDAFSRLLELLAKEALRREGSPQCHSK